MIYSIPRRVRGFVSKLLLAVLALICLAVGLLGLVLPLIPGLLFLLLAALCIARLSPALEARVKGLPGARAWSGHSDHLSGLSVADKCRYGFWMTLKVVVDTLERGWRAAGRRFNGP